MSRLLHGCGSLMCSSLCRGPPSRDGGKGQAISFTSRGVALLASLSCPPNGWPHSQGESDPHTQARSFPTPQTCNDLASDQYAVLDCCVLVHPSSRPEQLWQRKLASRSSGRAGCTRKHHQPLEGEAGDCQQRQHGKLPGGEGLGPWR